MPIYFSWFITALLSVSVVRTITTYRTVGAFLYCVNMASRVENRRSDCSLPVDIRRGFRRATSVRFGLVLFPVPAHRTGQADFPHPALGKDTRLVNK